METNSKHWRSRIGFVISDTYKDLQDAVNKFCEGKFVVGIQYPFVKDGSTEKIAVISYKVLSSESLE